MNQDFGTSVLSLCRIPKTQVVFYSSSFAANYDPNFDFNQIFLTPGSNSDTEIPKL